MIVLGFGPGLTPAFPSPPVNAQEPSEVITQEAGIRTPAGRSLRITPLVGEGDLVAQGAPVACLRDAPQVQLVAPMPGRVARISLQPGRKLSEIVLFREEGGDVMRHDVADTSTRASLRKLVQAAGVWPWLQRRPFGGMPPADENPAAIVVMAMDTRPFAPDPRQALAGRETALLRGLQALATLSDGPVFVCQTDGAPLIGPDRASDKLRIVKAPSRHPQGAAGFQVHALAPATIETPVWDIHAEDVAALGELLDTGIVPMTRLVRLAGKGLRESLSIRTQPGADLRELTLRIANPGAHRLISGSPLDGHEAHWLGPRHRQVTVLPRPPKGKPPHWFVSALTRSGLPRPVIPTAALTQAFGAALPAVALVRALSSGDDEMAMKLGALSLLEDDIALVDYVLGGEAHLATLLRGMLDRVQTEFAP
ncbi:Na(+)-translocating NADH-quinone reductase subunit A [Aliiroseovarius sp. S2029]|uniref:Na(+)-translocating NADH-quinone reductase subunit A n=1 Tax=Aliiroseovarius sp. S2029 TaxID=2936988 RepID=UPI0020BF84CD|nr:Na(+)-translocating NADH-quinone reductase subunit A [Aliiroseovarius sp. S2029]MCK8484226.1 Na(+)-translocating NADH-quinone reductase subunit A [Aliiroseovarius sp. S2029]